MDNRETHIPRLRFPAFSGGWEEKKFKDITFPVGKRNRQNLPYERYSISNEVGFYPQNEQFEDGGGYLKDIDCRQYIIVPPKSFAYNPARINVGSIGYQDLGKEVIVSSLYEVFQTKADCDDSFLWQWFHTDLFHKMVVNVQEGGVRQYFYYEKLKDCVILLPSISEQRRIAECLDTVDQIISAQQKKVEALKAYKKGLMQQLFPQSSEATPRLRFPGFTGTWEEKKLTDLAQKINRRNRQFEVTRVLTNSANDGVVDQNEYFDRDIVVKSNTNNYYIVELNDFVYNPRISTSAPVGPISINKIGKGIMSPLYTVFKFYKGYVPFFAYYFQTNIWHPYLKGIANYGARFDRMNITSEGFFNMPLYVPSSIEEQQKIASCLSSLDDTIQAETEKWESMKAHKKGLMQQLFPQPNK